LPLFDEAARRRAREFMENEVPPAALREPLGDHEFLVSIPASKTFLPGLFRAAGTGLPKAEYYQIAARMKPEEIPPEVTEVLDALLPVLGPAPASG
jgi:hypothetical protein